MSLCGATEKLVELTQSIGSANDIIDGLIDKIPITPAQGQAITDAAAIVAMASDAAAIQSLVTSKLKEYIPEIDILTAKLAVDDITNEVSNLKTKYSGLDLGNIDINDIPKLLKDGALDLNNLCQKIPNFEEDGAGFVLKGTPISTPRSSPIADLLGIQIPIAEEFVYRIDAVKKAKDAATNFVDVQNPDTIGI